MDVLDVNIKQFILDNNIHKEVNRVNKYVFMASYMGKEYLDIANSMVDHIINKYSYSIYRKALNINNAYYHRKSRVSNRLECMLSCGNCIFVTLTFTDEILNKTTYEIRRRYVREFFKLHSDYYIANIDFGEKNGREHYHGVVLCEYIDSSSWKYGYSWFNKIKNNKSSIESVSKYIPKLTNHAIKKSTGQSFRLIYGRRIKDLVLELNKKGGVNNES